MFIEFQSLLETFGVPITIYLPSEVDGQGAFVDTEWVATKLEDRKPLDLVEPFLPSSAFSQSSNYREGGRSENFSMTWLSTTKVPLKTKVKCDGIMYEVADLADYTGYSDVIQYGCKAVTTHGQL